MRVFRLLVIAFILHSCTTSKPSKPDVIGNYRIKEITVNVDFSSSESKFHTYYDSTKWDSDLIVDIRADSTFLLSHFPLRDSIGTYSLKHFDDSGWILYLSFQNINAYGTILFDENGNNILEFSKKAYHSNSPSLSMYLTKL